MAYCFNAKKTVSGLIEWVKNYFENTASTDTKAIIGISGGKDSSVAAAVCVTALGNDRVVGILMPQDIQPDIDYSRRVCDFLQIKTYTVNIGATVTAFMNEIKQHMEPAPQAIVNTPARIRMTTLYAAAATLGGRVVNTCNLSEDWVGYSTKYGDAAGDFAPLSDLTVTEVLAVGDELGLPYDIVHKIPTDGLCGKTDEENLGFTYAMLDRYIRGTDDLSSVPEIRKKIDRLHNANFHKLTLMPKFVLSP